MKLATTLGLHGDAAYTPPDPPTWPDHGLMLHRKWKAVYDHPNGDHWEYEGFNTIPDAWHNHVLDVIYGATAKDAGLYIGLVTGPGSGNTYAAGDTAASHSGWTEATPYSDSTRLQSVYGSASSKSISNSGSPAVFHINATATVAGFFLSTSSTKGGTGGLLAGVLNFSSGDKSVSSGGTLTVTVTDSSS